MLSKNDLDIPANEVRGIYVNPYNCDGAGPTTLCAGFEQPFTIEGTLTAQMGANTTTSTPT